MRLLLLLTLAVVSRLVNSSAVDSEAVDSPLKLSLAMTGNTKVKATLTNSGGDTLKLLKKGTFLDSAPVEKVQVYASDTRVQFHGIRLNILQTGLGEDAFTTIDAQQSIEIEFDMAELHDLSAGGQFTIQSQGAIPYATLGTTELSGHAVAYSSNSLVVDVDGSRAAMVMLAVDRLEDRSSLNSDCTGDKKAMTTTALTNCAVLAAAAAEQAVNGSATKFNEYFRTTADSVRKLVSDRLHNVSRECNSTITGATQYHCADTYQSCASNVLAYTLPARNYIVNCNIYFTEIPPMNRKCHGQDQATTSLHEMTHAPGVYKPGTLDNGYGYSAASKLNSDKAVNNADTYALYANAIYNSC